MSAIGVFDSVVGSLKLTNQAQTQRMMSQVPKDMVPFVAEQMKMQHENEITQLITQMMKKMHEMRMSVIKNIGG